MEKIRRNTEKISRSSERVGGGSLERRRSGDDSPVINQSTVHGIASPSRRPTIFDVFRARPKAVDLKKVRDKDAAKSSGSSEKDNISNSSSGGGVGPSGSGGHHPGIVQSVKTAMQHAVHRGSGGTGATGSSNASKYKDGSAHPHAGSDAQVGG